MQDFRKLIVWKRAVNFTVQVYRSTGDFPGSERFGLTAQLRNASSSVGANIAEGCGRGSSKDFLRYLHIAIGSAFEVENHLILARKLGYLDEESAIILEEGILELKRMLSSLIHKVKISIREQKEEGQRPSQKVQL